MPIEQIEPRQAFERMRDAGVPYVDVRTTAEYEAGHAQGAYNVPAFFSSGGRMVPNEKFASEVRARFAPGEPVILGCRTGARSQKACEILEGEGFQNLANDLGSFMGRTGIMGWSQDAALPTETGNPSGRAYEPGPG